MAKIFLDTNYFIDAIHRAPEKQILDQLLGNFLYVSTLSFHIYCYSFKIKLPNKKLLLQKEKFQLVDFSEDILKKALNGPTHDLEDNVQLHSSTEADCEVFLTNDSKLLTMKFFGKVQLESDLGIRE